MAMELSIVILDAYIMRHFNANELLYTFIFYICDFNKHAPCVLRSELGTSFKNWYSLSFEYREKLEWSMSGVLRSSSTTRVFGRYS